MKINKLQLKNFKCFDEEAFEFSPDFNVIIGDNGSGKTSLLKSLSTGISAFFSGLDGVSGRSITRNDIRYIHFEYNVEYQFPAIVKCYGVIDDIELEWERRKKSKTSKLHTDINIIKFVKTLQQRVRGGLDVDLPVLAYFPAKRIWELPEKLEIVSKDSRLRGYDYAILPISNYKFFTQWFKTMEIATLQTKKMSFQLEAVKNAVANCIEDCKKIFFDIANNVLVMERIDGSIMPFNRLSDGFRNMTAVVSDIAYRCVTLNPHKGKEALKSEGIILIDELDLHLHPYWQKKIVGDLKNTFPNIQFFVTTHSPLILSTLTNTDNVILLDKEKNRYIKNLFGRDVNDVLLNTMNIETNYEPLEKYFEFIELGKGKSQEAINLRKTIEAQMGADYHKLAKADALLTFYE